LSCLVPTKRYRLLDGTVVSRDGDLNDRKNPALMEFFTPCGQCGECRLSKARTWATRCVHESTLWKKSSFITLTYRQTPADNSLSPTDTRNFIRRLREHLNHPFKYFLVGEYGENFDRPHYHAIIFGHDFGLYDHKNTVCPLSGKRTEKETSRLQELHNTEALTCPELNEIWGLGFTSVGNLTFDSAAYTAQYAMKKVNGPISKAHYGNKHPEFMRCSQDGIGRQYALKHAKEIIENNNVISNSVEQPIPSYYLRLYEKKNMELDTLKIKREEFSSSHSLEKSYIRACKLDSKFKNKASRKDKLLSRFIKKNYLKDDYDLVSRLRQKTTTGI